MTKSPFILKLLLVLVDIINEKNNTKIQEA